MIVVELLLAMSLAVAAVIAYKRGNATRRRDMRVGLLLGIPLGVGAAAEGIVPWTIGIALGMGAVLLAPAAVRLWKTRANPNYRERANSNPPEDYGDN